MNAIMYIVKTGYVSVCAHMVIDSMRGSFPRLKKILAGGGSLGNDSIKEFSKVSLNLQRMYLLVE